MGRPVIPLKMTEEERKELNAWLRRRQMPAAEQQRARMVLLSTEGLPGWVIAEGVGVTAETVGKWRKRFEQFMVAGLTDAPGAADPAVSMTTKSQRSSTKRFSQSLRMRLIGRRP